MAQCKECGTDEMVYANHESAVFDYKVEIADLKAQVEELRQSASLKTNQHLREKLKMEISTHNSTQLKLDDMRADNNDLKAQVALYMIGTDDIDGQPHCALCREYERKIADLTAQVAVKDAGYDTLKRKYESACFERDLLESENEALKVAHKAEIEANQELTFKMVRKFRPKTTMMTYLEALEEFRKESRSSDILVGDHAVMHDDETIKEIFEELN